MELLQTLTLISAGVLAVILVAGLVAVVAFLVSIFRHLGDARASLVAAVRTSRDLGGSVERLHAASSACAAAMAEGHGRMRRAHGSLRSGSGSDESGAKR